MLILFDEIKEELEILKKIVEAKDKKVVEKVSKVVEVKVDELDDLKVDKNVFDEIKEELDSLKKIVHAKDENVAQKVSKATKVKSDKVNDLKDDKKDDERGNNVKKMVDKKDVIKEEDKDRKNETVSHELEGGMVEKVTKLKIEGEFENDKKKDENLAPIKEIFDAAKAQEVIVENLPEPPDTDDDEIKVKLKRLKRFNKKLLDDKNEVVIAKKIKLEADKHVDANVDAVEKLVKKKDKNVFDMKLEATENKEKTCKNESDGVCENELNNKLYDEVIPNVGVKDLNDNVMYKQVPGGACNNCEVGIGMSSFNLVPLLHTIDAMLLISGKTLHEQRRLVTRLSRIPCSNLNSHHQPETTQYSSSACSCQCQTRGCCYVATTMLDKVTRMESTACAVFGRLKRTFRALCVVAAEEMVIAAIGEII